MQHHRLDVTDVNYYFSGIIIVVSQSPISSDWICSLLSKPDRALGLGSRGLEQFSDGLENDLELAVVFLLHFLDFPPQIFMTRQHLA